MCKHNISSGADEQIVKPVVNCIIDYVRVTLSPNSAMVKKQKETSINIEATLLN